MNDKELDVAVFNRIYETFKRSAAERGFDTGFVHQVIESDYTGGNKIYSAHVQLNFWAVKKTHGEGLKRAVVEAEKDHLASILDMCGMLPAKPHES